MIGIAFGKVCSTVIVNPTPLHVFLVQIAAHVDFSSSKQEYKVRLSLLNRMNIRSTIVSVCPDLAMLSCSLRPCRVRPSSMTITLPRLNILFTFTTYQTIRTRHGF